MDAVDRFAAEAAVFQEWALRGTKHRGQHAVDAIRVLHSWLAAEGFQAEER